MLKSQRAAFKNPVQLLDYEIIQEQASALGPMGRALENALRVLREFDADHGLPRAPEENRRRANLVAEAGHALWMFVVQRESCGLRDSRTVMRDYKVPAEVQEQMGVFPATRK